MSSMEKRDMSKIIDEIHVGGYAVLKLDFVPKTLHKKYRIDGLDYDPVPAYDAENCIAVRSYDHFIGKTVEFI